MKVRAKFIVSDAPGLPTDDKTVHLVAATGPGSEDFTKHTPSGDIRIALAGNPKASQFFTPGKTVFVDFSDLEEAETSQPAPVATTPVPAPTTKK